MNEYKFSDIQIGEEVSFIYEITNEKMRMFREISGDSNPLHTDPNYAEKLGYSENVVYGQLTAAAFSTLAGMYMPGKYSLIHSVETSFVKPVFLSSCPLKVVGKVKDKDERFNIIILKIDIFDKQGQKVCKGKMQIEVLN